MISTAVAMQEATSTNRLILATVGTFLQPFAATQVDILSEMSGEFPAVLAATKPGRNMMPDPNQNLSTALPQRKT